VYETSPLFQEYISSPNREFRVKTIINGVEYDDKRIIQYGLEDALTENSIFAIGSVVSSKLTIQIKTEDIIASNAEIKPYIQLTGSDSDTEWVPLGVFYIDKRIKNRGVYEFTAYDRLIYANQKFDSSLTYPVSMQQVLDEILLILGMEADDSVVINPNYDVPYKDEEITINEMLSYIASAHAACFKMSKDGKLKMIRPAEAKTPVTIGRNLYSKITPTNPIKTITKLRCIYNSEGEYLEIGEGTEANTLEFTNMYITEDILTDIYNQLNGFSYLPISLDWRGNPAIEPGDLISLEEVNTLAWEDANMPWQNANFRWDGNTTLTTILLEHRSSFRGGLKMVSLSDSDTEQESEFPFEGQLKRTIQKMVQKDVPYYGVVIGRKNGLQIKRSDGQAEVTLNSDKLEFKAGGIQQLYFDVTKGKFIFNGEITTNALEAITITADKIQGGTLSGVTINVDTDAVVGDRIQLGSSSSNVILENNSDNFYLSRNNNRVLKFWSNGLTINGGIFMPSGNSIGLNDGIDDSTYVSGLYLSYNYITIGPSNWAGTLELNGYLQHRGSRLGFFSYSPASRTTVSQPSSIVTTQSAGSSYSSNEQNMLNNLKTDVINIRNALNNLRNALNSYGLV